MTIGTMTSDTTQSEIAPIVASLAKLQAEQAPFARAINEGSLEARDHAAAEAADAGLQSRIVALKSRLAAQSPKTPTDALALALMGLDYVVTFEAAPSPATISDEAKALCSVVKWLASEAGTTPEGLGVFHEKLEQCGLKANTWRAFPATADRNWADAHGAADVVLYQQASDSRADMSFELAGRMKAWRVTSDALDRLNICSGNIVFVDHDDDAADSVKPLDCVIAHQYLPGISEPMVLLRQFVPPYLLTTNSHSHNPIPLDLDVDNVVINGVVRSFYRTIGAQSS